MCKKNMTKWKNTVYWKIYSSYKTMLSYGLKCIKNTESKTPKVSMTKNGRIMLLSKCAVSYSKKSTFIKKKETSRFLSSLRIETSSSKFPLVGPLFLEVLAIQYKIKWIKQLTSFY